MIANYTRPEYCDNCGKDVTHKRRVCTFELTFAVTNRKIGEMATLCMKCSKPKGKRDSFRYEYPTVEGEE